MTGLLLSDGTVIHQLCLATGAIPFFAIAFAVVAAPIVFRVIRWHTLLGHASLLALPLRGCLAQGSSRLDRPSERRQLTHSLIHQ